SAAVSKWGFTLGFFDIYQLGTARSPSFSMGEGGGGAGSGLGTRGVQSYTAETVQTRFNEIDVFLQYHRSFGPLEATVGNIGYFSSTDWVDFDPFGAISYSYHDRTEPIPGSTNFTDIIRGRSLVGWNVAQAGLEIPIHLFHIV